MLRIGIFLLLVLGFDSAYAHQTTHFQLRDNLISVQASINGKNASAVLDSGTGAVVISKSLASELDTQLEPSSLQAAGAGKGDQSLFPLQLDTLRLGPLDLRKISAYAVDLNSVSTSAGFQIDALLGYPVLRNHAVRINYAKRYIKFYPKGQSPACQNPIPIKIIHNVPIVITKIKAGPGSKIETLHLMVDLGSRHYAAYLGGKFLETESGKALLLKGNKQKIGTGIGGAAQGVVANLSELDIGSHRFHDVTVALTKQMKVARTKFMDGTLGVPLWKGGTITLNYPERQLCISTHHK